MNKPNYGIKLTLCPKLDNICVGSIKEGRANRFCLIHMVIASW